MTPDTKTKETITGIALKRVVLKFIPPQFINHVDLSNLGFDNPDYLADGGLDLLQKLMEKSTDILKLYDTVEDFAADIHVYRKITSSHRFFGNDITEEYQTSRMVYYNQFKQDFYCKQDLFVKLQKLIFAKFGSTCRMTRSIFMINLKTFEKQLNGCIEFVRLEPNFLEKIMESEELAEPDVGVALIVQEVFDKLKDLLPGWTNESGMADCQRQFSLLDNTIESHPELFLPYDSVTIKKAPIVVRMFFNNYNHECVLRSELFRALNMITGSKYIVDDPPGFLFAMSMKEVREHFGPHLFEIEFIRVPLKSTKIKPVPIMTPTGGYCVYIDGALQGIHYVLNSVTKILNKIQQNREEIKEYVEWLTKELKIGLNCPYFITIDKYESIEQYTIDNFKQFESFPIRVLTFHDLKKTAKRVAVTDGEFKDTEEMFRKVRSQLSEERKNGIIEDYNMHSFLEKNPQFKTGQHFDKTGETYSEESSPELITALSYCSDSEESEISEIVGNQEEAIRNPEIEVQKLTEQLSCRDEVIESLKVENEKLEEKYKEHTVKMNKEFIDLTKATSTALSTCRKDIDTLQSKLSKHEDMESKLADANKKFFDSKTQWTKQRTHSETQLKAEQQNTHRMKQEAEHQKSRFQRKMSELDTKNRNALEEQYQKVRALEAQLKRTTNSKLELSKTITNLEPLLDESSRRVNKLEAELKRTTDSKAAFTRHISQLELQLATKNSEIDRLNQQLQERPRQPKSANLQFEELREMNFRLTERVEEQARTIKAFFNQFGLVRKEYCSSSTQTPSMSKGAGSGWS